MSKEKPQILIVDDDTEIRTILLEFLGRSYECLALESAEAALEVSAIREFDLIITDITMARMTGLDLVSYVIRQAPDSVIVMISGRRTIEFAIQAMRAGAYDYITKPFELSEVATVTRRALAHRFEIQSSSLPGRAAKQDVELLSAIERQEFICYYQPQVDIQTGRLTGVETLLRWQHPQRGLLSPIDFIPLAEKTGLIVPLGELVLRAACAQARHWHNAGSPDFRVAVNVSPQQLRQTNFPDTVAGIIKEARLPARQLEIEMTETSLMPDAELEVRNLTQLKNMGVSIAIDDFGTGYSSLSYLKRLPVDVLKLDASYVKDATTDPDDAALIMAIITLAHSLRLRVIAEGIETEEQLAFLRLLRCDEGQGYLLGRPAAAEALAEWFLKSKPPLSFQPSDGYSFPQRGSLSSATI